MKSTHITFFVPGKPRGKGRPRFSMTGHAYTDGKTREYEGQIQEAFRAASAGFGGYYAPKGQPICVSMVIRMPIPSSWSKARREKALERRLLPLVKPDIDNVCKAVLDALNGLAWADDTQVVRMDIHKAYSTPEAAGVVVFIRNMAE